MGKITEHVTSNKTQGEKVDAFCGSCMQVTNHVVLQSVDWDGYEDIGSFQGVPETIDWSSNYQIIQCMGCDSISFRLKSWCSEDQGRSCTGQFDDGSEIRLYPHRSVQTRPIKDYYSVPSRLRGIGSSLFQVGKPKLSLPLIR